MAATSCENCTAKIKLFVTEPTEEQENTVAARQFRVHESHVHYCRKQLLAAKPARKAFRGPKQGKYSAVEEDLLEYVDQVRGSGWAVSGEMLQLEVWQIATIKGITITSFKTSRQWMTRFMKRNDLSLQRRTTLCQ